MKITVSEIPEEGIELELKESLTLEPYNFLSPVHASIRIDKRETEVIVRGVIKGEVEQQCSRCVKNFSMSITAPIDVIYHPAEDIQREEHHELLTDELDTGFYKNGILDTDDLIREQFLLNMPMKPLCSPDCKGICPKCGADMNIAACNCMVSEIDSRLEVLKQLLIKKERSE